MSKHLAILILLTGCASVARADFLYDFEGCTPGALTGQGDWTTYGASSGQIITDGAISGSKSLQVQSISDGQGGGTDVGNFIAVNQGALNFSNIFSYKWEVPLSDTGVLDSAVRMVDTIATEMPLYTPIPGGVQKGVQYKDVWTFDPNNGTYGGFTFTTYSSSGTELCHRTYGFTSAPTFNYLQIDSHTGSTMIVDDMYYGPVGGPTTPEPSTLLLAITAAIGLLAYAWRKRM